MTMLILITKRIYKAVDTLGLYMIIAVYYLQLLHN